MLNDKEAEKLTRLLRGVTFSRPSLGLTALVTVFVLIARPGGILEDFGFFSRLLHLVSGSACFLLWAYFLLPKAVLFALRRGVPVLLMHCLVFFPLLPVTRVMPFVLRGEAIDPMHLLTTIFAGGAIVVFACVLALLYFQSFILPHLDLPITSEQLWRWTKVQRWDLISHLKPEVRGRILTMSAENQYVRVSTENGDDLLRTTLSEAEQRVDPAEGMRIHRSYWVAFREMKALGSFKGNPRLHTFHNEELPVSRKSVADIRRRLFEQISAH